MYFINFLRSPDQQAGGNQVEYRLACSGELYNRAVLTYDWRKSDVTRLLLQQPFSLLVTSQPFDNYPQELAARLTIAEVTEKSCVNNIPYIRSFLPDEDIIEDVCAVLTLLSRRLISPVVKTMEIFSEGAQDPWQSYPWQSYISTPIIDRLKVIAWPQRPATLFTTWSGQSVKFNHPPPVGVNDKALAEFFVHLAAREDAQDIVYAAHQYKTALELIEERPDTAYLALVSVVETLANLALGTYEPEEDERIRVKANVAKRARKLGLCEAQANEVALEATRSDRWLKRKFVKFCMDYCSASELSARDPVFLIPEFLCPAESDFETCLKHIYDARSANLHIAVPFPPGIGIGTAPSIKWKDLPLGHLSKPQIPPATWFERVVSISSRRFLLGDKLAPFIEMHDENETPTPVTQQTGAGILDGLPDT